MAAKKFFAGIFFVLAIINLLPLISAHCPLCTVGAGAAAAGAVWFGVSKVVVALFLGGFAMSMGMWFARVIEKRKTFFRFQNFVIIVAVFLLTIIPLAPIVQTYGPLYLSFIGDYGWTYALDYSLVSSLFGGLLVFFSPRINQKIKNKTRKSIPFQGVLITFILLGIAGLIIQLSFSSTGGVIMGGSVELLSPDQFEKVIQNESVFLLNVHTPYQGEIEGTNEIIEDWENIGNYMDKLPRDTSVPIAVYCRSGHMSKSVAEELKKMGYQTIYDLDGGMNAWEKSGRELI